MYQVLGFLNHLCGGTRPDISEALKILSKFGARYGLPHIERAKHLVRYLAGTKSFALEYKRVPGRWHNLVQLFTDASHASDPDTLRSVSGFVAKVCGNTVYWKSSFQTIVSHSSTESELMALDKGATLGQFVKWITIAVGAAPSMPIPIFVDNMSTIDIATNPVQPGRNVHVHARFFYIRDLVLDGTYSIHHLRTDRQVADLLVTFKSREVFERMRMIAMGCAVIKRENSPSAPGTLEWIWDASLL
jgi:hypothetical protein